MFFMNFFKIQISSLVSLPVTAVFIFLSLLFFEGGGMLNKDEESCSQALLLFSVGECRKAEMQSVIFNSFS